MPQSATQHKLYVTPHLDTSFPARINTVFQRDEAHSYPRISHRQLGL